MLFKRILLFCFVFKNISSKTAPSLNWKNCPNDKYSYCFELGFASGSDLAMIKPKNVGENFCIYEGIFRDFPKTRIFLSSNDCPINEFSHIYASFVHPRCPEMYFFEFSRLGMNEVFENLTGIIADEALYLPFQTEQITDQVENQQISAQGTFNLSLGIYFDKSFQEKFGSESVAK